MWAADMIWLSAALAAVFVVLGGRLLLTADPARLAALLRVAGPLLAALAGMVLTAVGRPVLGFPLVGMATVWALMIFGRPRRNMRLGRRRSTVRTAALEMDLDMTTGALSGVVLAGTFEGRVLRDLDLAALVRLRSELLSDPDSVHLLEAYLQSRFPTWRADIDAHVRPGKARPPVAGAMTQQEAYQILGLEPGASAADIRQAHRRLVQRLGADVGGPSFFAARIDEARDFLLSLHD